MFKLTRLALALAVAGSTLVVLTVQAPAQAAGCWSHGCNGKDPSVQGCGADAQTLETFLDGSFYVEMRYSAACHAAWTRVSTGPDTPGWFCNTVFAQIRGYNSSDVLQINHGVQAACPGQRFTKMVSFSYYVRSCLAHWFDSSPYVCTRRR